MRVRWTDAYRDRINGLRDAAGRARIQVRVDGLAHETPARTASFAAACPN